MKAVVIGGTGHIGTYLVPRLVDAGHEVVVVSRGQSAPYLPHPAWKRVQQEQIDRPSGDGDGTFGPRIAALEPDVLIDLISFSLASTQHLVEALRGKVSHYLHCGSAWVKGIVVQAPMREETPSEPLEEYGINKAAIERYLLAQARAGRFPATMVNPGHIVGPGHLPINPLGNKNPEVFRRLARGEALYVPNFGMETLHHVHADDVAQVFMQALTHWSAAVGQAFFAVSPAALTVRGYAEEVSRWFGRQPDLRFVSWDEWTRLCGLPASDIATSESHLARSNCYSMDKARQLLGYQPRYTSLGAVYEALAWQIEHQALDVTWG